MQAQKLPKAPLAQLATLDNRHVETKVQWDALLVELDIVNERHVRIATEGALLGSVLEHGLKPDLVVVSDDAGQFDLILILHALCWIHAERTINKLVGFNDPQREALVQIRTRIWDYYDDMQAMPQEGRPRLQREPIVHVIAGRCGQQRVVVTSTVTESSSSGCAWARWKAPLRHPGESFKASYSRRVRPSA